MSVLDHIVSQYNESEKLKAVLQQFEDMLDADIGEAVAKLFPQMTTKAEGYWLDLLAKRFVLSRPTMGDPTQAVFFGLVGDPPETTTGKATFGKAPFSSSATQPNRVYASDVVFEALISFSASRLRTNGTQDQLTQILDSSYKYSCMIDEQHSLPSTIIETFRTSDNGGGSFTIYHRDGFLNGKPKWTRGDHSYQWDSTNGWWERYDYGIGFSEWNHPTATGYLPDKTGWPSPAEILELSYSQYEFGKMSVIAMLSFSGSTNDGNVFDDNPTIIPKPVGVALSTQRLYTEAV